METGKNSVADNIRRQIQETNVKAKELGNKVKELHTLPMIEHEDARLGKVMVTKHVYNLIVKDRKEACPQRTPPWYKKRQDHITASLMATICGANPYETRASALKRKTGVEKPFKGNAATEHGNKYEMEAIIKYEKRTQQKCLEFGLLESLNEGEEFLAGSPDGITTTGHLIEVKCPYRRTPTEVIPEHYRYQIQFLMHTLQLPCCDFIQYVPETEWNVEVFIVTREMYNPYFWIKYFPVLKTFWADVLEVRRLMEKSTIIEDGEDSDDCDEDQSAFMSLEEIMPKKKKKRVVTITLEKEDTPKTKERKKKVKVCEMDTENNASDSGLHRSQASEGVLKALDNMQKRKTKQETERRNQFLIEHNKSRSSECHIDV